MRAAATAIRSAVGAVIFAGVLAAPASAEISPRDLVVADPSANGGSGALIRVDPDSGRQTLISSNAISSQDHFADPVAVALGEGGGLLVADREAFGGTGGVIRVDPDSGQQSLVSSNSNSPVGLFAEPSGIVVTPSGTIYVVDRDAYSGTGGVIEVDPETGRQTAVASNASSGLDLFDDPAGVLREANGDLAIADLSSPPGPGDDGAIVGLDLDSGQEYLISNNSLSGADLFEDPFAVAAEANGNLLVANDSADPAAKGVIRVSRFSGQQSALSSDFFFTAPTGIGLDTEANAIVADQEAFGGSGGLIRAEPAHGGQTAVSNNFTSEADLFADPAGVFVVPPICRGEYATIVGTEGDDTLVGTAGRDVIATLGGKDIAEGRGGADRICGSSGRSRLIGGNGPDRLSGGEGSDVILAGGGADAVKGERGADKIDGGGGRDTVTGNKGNDTLTGGKAGDRLFGNRSRDKLFGDSGNDLLNGGIGPDRLRGGPGDDELRGGPGRDRKEQ